jgi:hypothetical protein
VNRAIQNDDIQSISARKEQNAAEKEKTRRKISKRRQENSQTKKHGKK